LFANLGTIMLPAPVEGIAVAASGRILVLKLRARKGLTVYDTRARQLKTIELPTSDFTFGAGGNVALVFLKEDVELRSYNLTTLKKVRSKEFVDPVIVQRIVMGHSRDDLAFLRTARNEQSSTSNVLLDVAALKFHRPTNRTAVSGYHTSFSSRVHHRATGDMSRLTEWCSGSSGIYLHTRTREGYQLRGNWGRSSGYLAMGDDGKIYTGFGQVMDLKESEDRSGYPLGSTATIVGQSLFPGIGGLFFLGLKMDGTLCVYQAGATTPLCPLDAFPRWAPPLGARQAPPKDQPPDSLERSEKETLTLDRRIVFAPAADHIIFVPHSNDRLIHRKFDLKAALDRTGKDYLLVNSSPPLRAKAGVRWDYRIATLQKHGPVKLELEKAPEGMSLSPGGQLTWKIPGGVRGTAEVVVAIKDSKANVIRDRFTLAFE
jgi:hypothetical protein